MRCLCISNWGRIGCALLHQLGFGFGHVSGAERWCQDTKAAVESVHIQWMQLSHLVHTVEICKKKHVWHEHFTNTTCLFMESICFSLVHSHCLCFTHFYLLLLIFTHFYAFLRIFTHFYAYVILLFRRFKKHWEAGFVNKKMKNKKQKQKNIVKKFSSYSSLDHRKHYCTNVAQTKPALVGLHSIIIYFGILFHKLTRNLIWHSDKTAIMYYERRNYKQNAAQINAIPFRV